MPANIDPLLDLDTLLDDSHRPPVARWGHVTGTCQWDEGWTDVGHLEEEAQGSHFLSPFVCHPDTKDSGEEATAPVNRMTRWHELRLWTLERSPSLTIYIAICWAQIIK